MIKRETFTLENIQKIQKEFKVDPNLAQRAIFALGLVEALRKVNADFIFKGGSSLMLLFNIPKRLSTDIDILVEKDYDIYHYIVEAAKIFPFTSVEESIRNSFKNISKKHYRFTYLSPINNRKIAVLLDVLFGENKYKELITKPIKNSLLVTDENDYYIKMPSVESLLGDKLTAFAPHTIGIKYNNDNYSNDKRLEVIKQLYDIVILFDISNDYEKVKNTYFDIAKQEIAYRNINITPKECLLDTFNTALSLLSWGKFNEYDYRELVEGVNKIQMHIVKRDFNMNSTPIYAAKIMFLSACLIKDVNPFSIKISHKDPISKPPFNKINFILKNNEFIAFDYAVAALEILYSKELNN